MILIHTDIHAWLKWFTKLAGSWKITWGSGKAVELTISAGGTISLPGLNYQLHLLISDNAKFPAAKGKFSHTIALSSKTCV